ncbi:uncharacterized protein [Euwallacea similis]|uniref:uncharacterized protein n=1 Tax=Euwallacea similis TaxID=1736056 RepID=UPI00344C62C4
MGSTPSKAKLIEILNETIVAEKSDAQFLHDLLSIKLSITDDSSDTKTVSFDPSFVLEQNNLNFDLVVSILEKSLKIWKQEDISLQLKKMGEYIQNNSTTQSNVLKLLHFMVFYCVKDNATLLYEHVNPSFATKFLIDQLNTAENKSLAYDTLILLFQIYKKSDQIDCLQILYNSCCHRENLDVFCGLLHYVPGELFHEETSSLTKDTFWIYIESCISGPQSHLQKQGTYILSKYVAATTSENKIKNIFVSVNTKNSWEAFFLLVDVGREKQLHLVTPALPLLQHLPHLPFLWQKCCYKIYLNHSQSSIVYHVANNILKSSFTGDCLKDIMELVLPVLNKNEYTDHSCEVFSNLGVFCLGLSFCDFKIVIDEVTKITWNSVSFWKIVQNVLTQPNAKKIFLQSEVCNKIITITLNLPHMHIRDQCLTSLTSVMYTENMPLKVFKISQFFMNAGIDHSKYLKHLKISDQFVDLVMKNKHNYKNFKHWFKLFKIAHINSWPYVEKSLHDIDTEAKLFVWRDYLSWPHTSTILDREIEKWLITYAKCMCEESTDNFICLFKESVAKGIVGNNTFMEIIHEPLFLNTTKYNQNQIYVALVLVQDYLFDRANLANKSSNDFSFMYSKISVDVEVNSHKVFIKFIKGSTVSKIVVKSPRVCIAFINLLSITHKNGSPIMAAQDITKCFKNFLEQYDNRVLKVLYAKTLELISLTYSLNIMKGVILLLFENISRIKKDQHYKDVVNEFIKIVFSERFYKLNVKNDSTMISPMSKQLLCICDLYPILRLNWLKEMRNLVSLKWNYYDICVEPAVEMYLQGTVVSKDKRTEYSLCQEIANYQMSKGKSCNFDDTTNPNILNAASRFLALDLLLFIGQQWAGLMLVINFLTAKYKKSFKERYFVDSMVHYEKLRILQALLLVIFQCQLSDFQSEQISAFVLDCFEEENNQNCIKQILHWMLILIFKDVSPILSWITSKPNFPPSVLINIIPSLYHLSILGNEETLNKTVNLVLPWTMGAQFKLRVYSQGLIKRLIDHGKEKGYHNFIQERKYLETCISNCISASGDNFTNALKTDLVFLNHFHPVKDKSWAVLWEISRLNKVHPSEWQNLRVFIANPLLLRVRLLTKNLQLQPKISSFSEAVDAFLSSTESPPEPTTEINFEIPHIQRKTAPWKTAFENPELKTSDFILIASLIEKSQNLGGLSRTCEVFGIKDIVFNDANVIKDKEFKSLSMSSESWINVIEVKVADLSVYIKSLQKEGYCVVGAEQTARSSKLHEYEFPKKTALVLGHEKTGISPEIIPLLDVCIEIPQFGQTRSLNVHVAGALFMWEYFKQRLKPPHKTRYAYRFRKRS